MDNPTPKPLKAKPIIVGPPVLRITMDLDGQGNIKVSLSQPISAPLFISILAGCIKGNADAMAAQAVGIVNPNGRTILNDSAKDDGEKTPNNN